MSRALLGAVLFCITTGCSAEGAQLFVTVRTDWVPGVEFGGVSVRVDEPSGASSNVAAFVTDDYAAGVRVAALSDLAAGTHHLVVTLLETESGDVLDEANVRVDLREGASLAVTVILTREEQTCAASSECTSAVACVEGSCVDGACLFAPESTRCGSGEYCDPDQGCTPIPVTDGGVTDGRVADGGSPTDGGLRCSSTATIWRRSVDWTEGVAQDSSEGNPTLDSAGQPTWFYELTAGGPLGSPDPWYAARPTLLLWDASWYGGAGAWAQSDDRGPVIATTELTHIADPSWWAAVPRVRWQNPTSGSMMVTVSGRLDIYWAGIDGVAAPIDVDVVVARLDRSGSLVEELLAASIPKPTADTSSESAFIMMPPRTVMTLADESIVVSLRARFEMDDVWMELRDDLTYAGVPCE